MKVAVTGAGGFVGRATTERLRSDGHEVLPIVRTPQGLEHERIIIDLGRDIDWAELLEGVDAVVHLAGRAHVDTETARDPLLEYRRVNRDGTLNLARQAARIGVRRFLFMSSIKVNGEETQPGRLFRRNDTPAPTDPYAVSKYEAEQGLAQLRDSGMEVVVIRPPLVYGPGVKGNFLTLLRAVKRGLPLPLGAVRNNRRSLIGLGNLVDLTSLCLTNAVAANKLYLVSDGRDLSTRALIELIGKACGRQPRLLPVPPILLLGLATLVGKGAAARRVVGSLQVDLAETRSELDWRPPWTIEEELDRLVASAQRAG